jgi:cytoskeletal protein CcmA (bactofilin family)
MQTTRQSEKGMALVMALSAIVVIGVMMAGVVFVTTQDYRIGGNTVRTARAAAASELGLNGVLVDWNLADNSRLQTGATLTKSYTAPRGATANVIVTRLPGPFFWVVSEGYAGGLGSQGSGRRRYGTLFRLDTPAMNFMGAITTQGAITVRGNVTVSGYDGLPATWPSCGALKDVAGAAISPTTTYDDGGDAKVKVYGSPTSLTTPAAGDTNTYFNYGSSSYQSLAAAANLTYEGGLVLTGVGPVTVGGVCQPSLIPANWGDPNRASPAGACESSFPIIHAKGDLKVTTGRGQGVLLVDGNFTVAGNFEFTGIVIARGGLKMSGTGNKITGGVMAAQVSVTDDAVLTGNTTLQYSSCAILSALSANAYPKQAKERGWVDVY